MHKIPLTGPRPQHPETMNASNLLQSISFGLAMLVTGTLSALPGVPKPASTVANSKQLEHAVRHQINRHVIFPLDAEGAEMYGVVDVAYAVDVKGRLVVKEASSRNAALREYVVRKLGKIQVGANPSGLWNTTHVRFTFRPEHKPL